MFYRYAYKYGDQDNKQGKFLRCMLQICTGGRVFTEADPDNQKIKIAIIGAGNVGVSLAEDLRANPQANYTPRCFIDNDHMKVGRDLHGVAVLNEDKASLEMLKEHQI